MASLNTSINGPSIKSSYTGVVNSSAPAGAAANSPTYGQWALFSVSAPLVNAFQQDSGGKESILKVQSTGEGELIDLIDDFSEGRVQFAFVKVKDPNTALPKYVLIGWCGEGVPERTKGYFVSHLAAVSKILHGYHVQITARSDRDLTPEGIVQKVADASGAKYSAGSTAPTSASGPPPPVASKPVFNPTRTGAASSFNPLASSRSRFAASNDKVDDDGWGEDAPQVTRSQLEKVAPAYQPTKVNMAELTKQKQEPPRFSVADRSVDHGGQDVVKGGYQPVGKVDIAAIRAQAQSTQDDRPTIVKGAYEPVGKVDIAAIKARAQKPSGGEEQSSSTIASASGVNDASDESGSRSLSDRSASFTQSERLTTLPKPKVASRFGSNSTNFSGTKAPVPGDFGLQSAPSIPSPPVGVAKTFGNEGGKTPAQIWAEKKARERGLSGSGDLPQVAFPVQTQKSGGTEWKSGYAGKSWAPVETSKTARSDVDNATLDQADEQDGNDEEAPTSSGGIGALRDRFKGGAPMGAPSIPRETTGEDVTQPPPVNASTRPTGGIPMPGIPARPPVDDDVDEDAGPDIPPPPRIHRSPTPEERETSPVRLVMPVARGQNVEIEPAEERNDPPALPSHIAQNIPDEEDLTEQPTGQDPARVAGSVVAAASFGNAATTAPQNSTTSGKRALIQYDYEKAEDNELELVEGEYVSNIEMVDDDWWMGTNSKGESGLFPRNYVELVQGDEEDHPAPEPAHELETAPEPEAEYEAAPALAPRPSAAAMPAAPSGPSAKALYDYDAAEDNELSFPEDAIVTGLEFPDRDWWFGHYDGKSGLFPANYVQLDE